MEKEIAPCLDMCMTGAVLRHAIDKSGYSVRQLQEMLHLAYPQPIYKWMKGHTLPTLDNLYILSSILGVHMEDLLIPRQDRIWQVYRNFYSDNSVHIKVYLEKLQQLHLRRRGVCG